MKTYLVTGGSGFIGSNFIRFLLSKESNCHILNLDKLTYAGNPANLKDIENDKRYKFINGDICDEKIIRDIFSNQKIDVVINFAAEKMTLRVPIGKAEESGLRKISTREKMQTAIGTLRGRPRSKRTMWSRRAQEYEANINSGDPIAIAQVVRDLHRPPEQPDQSYSERQMYEAALNRLALELALVEKIEPEAATERLETLLLKAA